MHTKKHTNFVCIEKMEMVEIVHESNADYKRSEHRDLIEAM
jgi:hypothetical protein